MRSQLKAIESGEAEAPYPIRPKKPSMKIVYGLLTLPKFTTLLTLIMNYGGS